MNRRMLTAYHAVGAVRPAGYAVVPVVDMTGSYVKGAGHVTHV